MDAQIESMLSRLREHASTLNGNSKPSSSATVFYDAMSGALIWTDEKPEGVPVEVIWSLRPVWRFRSSLIGSVPEEKWRWYWDQCRALFPRWIGFLPERCTPTPDLTRRLKVEERLMERCLDRMEKEREPDARPNAAEPPPQSGASPQA